MKIEGDQSGKSKWLFSVWKQGHIEKQTQSETTTLFHSSGSCNFKIIIHMFLLVNYPNQLNGQHRPE